jgi:hypothetical protein
VNENKIIIFNNLQMTSQIAHGVDILFIFALTYPLFSGIYRCFLGFMPTFPQALLTVNPSDSAPAQLPAFPPDLPADRDG